MKRTALILAGVIAFDLGVMAVAAQARQQTREPPRIPTTSTGPTFPGPQRSTVQRGVPACAPGERPPCHGPSTPRLPGAAAAVAGPPPVDEGPGPYDPYPRENARAAPTGSSARRADPPPGGCVLRPGNPLDCGDGEGPAAIGGDTVIVFRFCYLPSDTTAISTFRANCPFPDAPAELATSCTASGGTLAESNGAVGCTLPRNRVAAFERSIGRSAARR